MLHGVNVELHPVLAERERERARQGLKELGGRLYHHAVLADRERQTEGVDFLKRVGTD